MTLKFMSEFKFSCPQCDQHLQCDEQFSGRQIQCPRCNHLIRIPSAPGKTAQFEPQSGMTWATFVPTGEAEPPKKPAVSGKKPPEQPDKK
jgi:DNA-directed RNA polymerase subunit RPC12/RpoP